MSTFGSITTIDGLIEYIKRSLGYPVIRINVTDDQFIDRINDALSLYREYHFNATEKVLLAHALSETEIANKEIILPDNVTGIEEVYPGNTAFGGGLLTSNYIYLFQEMRRTGVTAGLTSYLNFESKAAEFQSILNTKLRWNFVKHRNALKIITNWNDYVPGQYIVIEGWIKLDPEEHPSMLNDPWLIEYSTWLIKRQMATNLSKFANVTLPGGVTINADEMMSMATENIQRMRDEIMDKWMMPPMIHIG
jgi:hypothetical protein